jgi:DHA2 family lincomycin resistance protein-like MFS transporter
LKKTAKKNSTIILAILVFSTFIGLFNETILNIALNILMEEMNITAGTVQWLVTAYMIVTSIMVPITAFLIQSYEIKKLYLGAMGILLAGTIGAACSDSFGVLLVSRMVQAVGTGMMIPIMMNTVLIVTPIKKRGLAMGICVCAIQFGPAFGPTFSGLILQFFNWHVLFAALIPFIMLSMIIGYICLVNVTTLTKPKIDIVSIILSTVGVGGIIFGLNGFSTGENIKLTIIIFIVGIISLIFFGKRQLLLKDPMLEIHTFKYRIFSICTVFVMISMMIIFTMNVMLPMFLQEALKTTTFISAMVLLPATLTNGFATLVGGKIYDKLGPKVLIPVGYAVILVSLFILSRSNVNTSLVKIMVTYIAVCIGVGCTMSPSQTNALNQLPKEIYPHGVAIISTLQQIAAAIGSSLFIGIMSASQLKALSISGIQEVAAAIGFRAASSAMLIFVLVGLLLSFSLKLENKKLLYDSKLGDIREN